MLLLQFSTSHYCRKARLMLGFKRIPYQVKNLTPGVHLLSVKPLTGLSTLPVLLLQQGEESRAIADSSRILEFLEQHQPDPPLLPSDYSLRTQVWTLEDWLDESIGVATRFVYYDFRAGAGRSLDPSWMSQLVIQVVRKQYEITPVRVQLARERLQRGLDFLAHRWQEHPYLVGDRPTAADLTAAALLSPLVRIPDYRQHYPWLLRRITEIHQLCDEALPPGLEEAG